MKLGVNIDHVATLRQARLAKEPNVIRAAILAEMGGADGITVHLREDRRHIQDEDVKILRQVVTTKLNLEMSIAEEMIKFAQFVKPDMVTLVPEKRQELTTEGGLNLLDLSIRKRTEDAIKRLKEKNIVVSLFVEPKAEIMRISREIGADYIEIHTGRYSEAKTDDEKKIELERVIEAVKSAKALGLDVNAGHGLDYKNVGPIAKIKEIEELNIGHAIVAKSLYDGIENAVKQMKEMIVNARLG